MGGEQSWDRARWLWILALIGGISFFIAVYQRWDGPAIWAWKAKDSSTWRVSEPT